MDEIKGVLKGSNDDMKKMTEVFKKYDINGDGEIDINEFVTMMSKIELEK